MVLYASGKDMKSAFKTAKILENDCTDLYMIDASGGKPAGISPENIAAMQEMMKSYGQK